MPVIGGIRVFQLRQDHAESIGEKGPAAQKSYLVPDWNQRYTVANALMGLASYSGGSVGLTAPVAYPESSNLWAQTITIRGVGSYVDGPKQGQFDSAIVSVTYGIPAYNVSQSQDPGGQNSFDPTTPLVFAQQTLDYSAMYVDCPPGTLTVNDGSAAPNNLLNQPYALPVALVSMNCTLYRLPYILPSAKRLLPGSVNNATFWGCATKKLRFDGARTERTYSVDGTIVQDTHMRFTFRPDAPWDQILHPGDPTKGWVEVQRNGSSILNGKTLDFTTLLPSAYTSA